MTDVSPDFVITKIGSNFVGALETPAEELARFTALATFLEEHDLAARPLRGSDGNVPSDFTLRRRDITSEGFALLRAAYPRWLAAVDRTKNASNVGILLRELHRMRSGATTNDRVT